MKILKETQGKDGSVDLEIDLEPDEEVIALEVGSKILPNEKDYDKLMQAALEYFIVLGIINDYEEIQK